MREPSQKTRLTAAEAFGRPHPPGPVVADFDVAARLVENLPFEVAERLARTHFSPSALRRRRLDERDAALRELAIGMMAKASTGESLARTIARELHRYASSAWRFERERPAPVDPPRALLYRILHLGSGHCPGQATVHRALAGLSQNQPRF
jgi:hypothetical protein